MKGVILFLFMFIACLVVAALTVWVYVLPIVAENGNETITSDNGLGEALVLAERYAMNGSRHSLYLACQDSLARSLEFGAQEMKEALELSAGSYLNSYTFSGYVGLNRYVEFPVYNVSLGLSAGEVKIGVNGGPLTYMEGDEKLSAMEDSVFSVGMDTGCWDLYLAAVGFNSTLPGVIEDAARFKMREQLLNPVTRTFSRDDIADNLVPYQICEKVIKAETGHDYNGIGSIIGSAVRSAVSTEAGKVKGFGVSVLVYPESNVIVESYNEDIRGDLVNITCQFSYTLDCLASVTFTEKQDNYLLWDGSRAVSKNPLSAVANITASASSEGIVPLESLHLSGLYSLEFSGELPDHFNDTCSMSLVRSDSNLSVKLSGAAFSSQLNGVILDEKIDLGPTDMPLGGFNSTTDICLNGTVSFAGDSFSGVFRGYVQDETVWKLINGTFTATKTS